MSAARHRSIAAFLVLFIMGGCSGGKSLVTGRASEGKGEPQVAYEQYCRAAIEHPGSVQVAAALARVRPSASAYWESQALLQMDQGHFDEAWQMLIKALEIEPNSIATAKLIRQIEVQHSAQVATAKLNWQQRRNVALAAVTRSRKASPAPPVESDVRQFVPTPEAIEAPPAEPVSDHAAPATTIPDASSVQGSADSDLPSSPEKPGKSGPRPVIRPAFPRRSAESDRTESGQMTADHPGATKPGRRDRLPKAGQPLPARPPVQPSIGEFTVVKSMSLKDRSMPRSMTLADGVEIRLKDTDADLEADFDAYIGKSRVKKIRGMKIGRSQILTGSSGELYRLTLLGIHHPTHTVRVGIKPA